MAMLVTRFAMYDICSRSKGQRSRSQGHVTYQQAKTLSLGSVWSYQLQTWWELSTWGSTRMVYFLGQWVKRPGNRNMAHIQHIKCKKSTENVGKSLKFCTLTGNRGRRIERRCLNLHRKSTSSTRTTAIRHFMATLTERVISRMRTN